MKKRLFFLYLMFQVSVPGSNLSTIVTVRCGHCGNLLSVNMGALPQSIPPQELQVIKPLFFITVIIFFYLTVDS